MTAGTTAAMPPAAERRRLLRYALVGGTAAAGNGGVMILADRMGFGALAASVLAFVVVTPIAYLLHARVTFDARPSWQALAAFAASLTGAALLSTALVVLLRDDAHLPMPLVAAATCAAMVPLNYLLSRLTIVRRRRAR